MKVEVINEGQPENGSYQTAALSVGRFLLRQLEGAGYKLPERQIGFSFVRLDLGLSAQEVERYILSRTQDITLLVAARAIDYKLGLGVASVMSEKYGFVVTQAELPRVERIKAAITKKLHPHGIIGLVSPAFANELNSLNKITK